MKKTLVLLAALAWAPLSHCLAQPTMAPTNPPDERTTRQVQALTRQLSLTPEQSPRVESILQAQLQALQALKDKYPAGQCRGAMGELRSTKATYDAQLQAVLTPEQFAKLEQLRQERREQLRERRSK